MARSTRQQMLPGLEPDSESTETAEPGRPSVGKPTSAAPLDVAKDRGGEGPEARSQTEAPESAPASRRSPNGPVDGPRPKSLADWTVWVIDANSLIFQVYHAVPEMTSPHGEPVNAVYGFVRDLVYLLQDKQPDCLLCAFDLPGPTFRHAIYDGYKADRTEMPDDLRPQFPKIMQTLEALGIPALSMGGFEADDVLATVAVHCEGLGGQCVLVTGDKDCRQLITEHVRVYNIRTNEFYDAAALRRDWGIRPDQVVDFQSLVGDSVDNVPGVRLIGPKIASQLLADYGTLENVLEHAGEVKGTKRSQNLLEGREIALLSRELVQLRADVPLEIDWNRGRPGRMDAHALSELMTGFGFRSLGERVRQLASASDTPETTGQGDYRLVDTPEKLGELIAALEKQERFSLDTETTHIWPRWAEIVGYSFSWKPGQAYYVPVRGPSGEQVLDPQETAAALRGVLENPSIEKVGQNLKYDQIVLRRAGIHLRGTAFDTMLASYLLDAGQRNHNLDELASRYLNHQTTKISELIGSGKNQKRMDEVTVAAVCDYAAEDADIPLRLAPPLAARLDEDDLTGLFRDVEVPLIEVLAELEYNGVRVDKPRLAELSGQFGRRLETLESEIYELAGHEFNIASPKQLASVLFDELKLPVVKKTKTGPSTDAETLEQLAAAHPLPAKIIDYRQNAKLKNTYVDSLPEQVHPETGRVHCSFNQVVAATGRLSSSDPNLQNIPIRTEMGRQIRSAFVPGEPGWKLLAADYSQIELRVLAHFCGDRALCEAFANDEDIHASVASQVYETPLESVTSDMRRSAKAVNFGIIYGQSPFGLAKALGIEKEAAAEFIDAYFARYPGVEDFLEKTLAACRKNGYVKTLLGRRRVISGVRDPADPGAGYGHNRNLPERTAINTVIQGSAADLIKLAMLSVHARLRQEKLAARMLLQIHDELIFEVPPIELEPMVALVRREMTGVMDLSVPLKVDLKSGDNWAECEPWE